MLVPAVVLFASWPATPTTLSVPPASVYVPWEAVLAPDRPSVPVTWVPPFCTKLPVPPSPTCVEPVVSAPSPRV